MKGDGKYDKTKRDKNKSIKDGFAKEETAKSTEEEERNGMKKPKTRILHSMRRKSRPTSSQRQVQMISRRVLASLK